MCGNPPGRLLDYYYKFDSVGIIYWPDLTVIDTVVRTYDDDGNETLEGALAHVSLLLEKAMALLCAVRGRSVEFPK